MSEATTSTAPTSTTAMTSSAQADVPGLPFYEKSRLHLRDLLRKQQALQRNLANLEETIYRKETEYLEDTPSGNIILGFDGFVKGASVLGGGTAGRRGVEGDRSRGRGVDGVRLFSRSSVSYRPGGDGVVRSQTLYMYFRISTDPIGLNVGFTTGYGCLDARKLGSYAGLDVRRKGNGGWWKWECDAYECDCEGECVGYWSGKQEEESGWWWRGG